MRAGHIRKRPAVAFGIGARNAQGQVQGDDDRSPRGADRRRAGAVETGVPASQAGRHAVKRVEAGHPQFVDARVGAAGAASPNRPMRSMPGWDSVSWRTPWPTSRWHRR